jgi:Glycosyl hydrolase family 14
MRIHQLRFDVVQLAGQHMHHGSVHVLMVAQCVRGWTSCLLQHVQVVMSFHSCGTNVNDNVHIPLPEWVQQVRCTLLCCTCY